MEGGFLSRNGAGQEVGCCDLSEICQPHCLSRKGRQGERGIAKWRVGVTFSETRMHIGKAKSRPPQAILLPGVSHLSCIFVYKMILVAGPWKGLDQRFNTKETGGCKAGRIPGRSGDVLSAGALLSFCRFVCLGFLSRPASSHCASRLHSDYQISENQRRNCGSVPGLVDRSPRMQGEQEERLRTGTGTQL